MKRALLTAFGRHLVSRLAKTGALSLPAEDLKVAVDDAVTEWLRGPRGDR